MAKSGAMLKYLNGNVSVAGSPNENFAREFWELFTLGVDRDYTQADVVEASRAWTGYKFVTNPSTHLVDAVPDETRHDAGAKTILGQAVAPGLTTDEEFRKVVDITVDHGHVAEFVTARIFEHFGFENPSPALVAAMASNLRQGGYELAPFLKALFRSEAFFSAAARGALVKSPVDFTVGFVHATGLKPAAASYQTLLAALGQSPTEPPSVNGWPQGAAWFSGQNMADRANFLDACITETVATPIDAILPPAGQRTDAQIVDALVSVLGPTLRDDERQRCIDHLNSNGPFDGTSQAQIDDRVRGLLYVLAQLPSYQVR
jgi:uncharacterized protein (DUF1800 family)